MRELTANWQSGAWQNHIREEQLILGNFTVEGHPAAVLGGDEEDFNLKCR